MYGSTHLSRPYPNRRLNPAQPHALRAPDLLPERGGHECDLVSNLHNHNASESSVFNAQVPNTAHGMTCARAHTHGGFMVTIPASPPPPPLQVCNNTGQHKHKRRPGYERRHPRRQSTRKAPWYFLVQFRSRTR